MLVFSQKHVFSHVFRTPRQLRGARVMGNHPDNQRVSDANQWPHHFNMLGQLLLGFIFMIVVFFLYVVRPGVSALAPFRFPTGRPERSRAPPTTDSLTRPSSLRAVPQTHYLRNKRAERLRRGKASSVSGAMEGGGVAGLAQMRAKLSGKSAAYERLGMEDGGESGGGGLGASSSSRGGGAGGSLKRTGSGTGATILESARHVVEKR